MNQGELINRPIQLPVTKFEIIELLIEGKSYREIARLARLSPARVRQICISIHYKCHDRHYRLSMARAEKLEMISLFKEKITNKTLTLSPQIPQAAQYNSF